MFVPVFFVVIIITYIIVVAVIKAVYNIPTTDLRSLSKSNAKQVTLYC